ncbi:endoribonuclease L-PSP [Anopheles sinensis]|uniref:Endoribonuclease L-PSP n=1 Tax=Anopheles sinensis TaxID=74873 RepID=A0A084VWD8_ANOSI|nr:endoribonuclease L-PSP [Anopheles sinensis]
MVDSETAMAVGTMWLGNGISPFGAGRLMRVGMVNRILSIAFSSSIGPLA